MSLSSASVRAYSTKERVATATHVVSYWWLPGGYDVVHARVCFAFFDNEQEAQQFTKRYEGRPHMASLMTRAEWEKIDINQRMHINNQEPT